MNFLLGHRVTVITHREKGEGLGCLEFYCELFGNCVKKKKKHLIKNDNSHSLSTVGLRRDFFFSSSIFIMFPIF